MRTWITREPIDPAAVLEAVGDPGDGAVLLFLGTVRDHNDGRPVAGVRYEAYDAMASAVLSTIAKEAADRFGTPHAAVVHRVGELGIGDVSVAIAVSSPHRAAGFDATRYIIEEIKKRLPVWKREHYLDGDPYWLDGTVPPVPDRARE